MLRRELGLDGVGESGERYRSNDDGLHDVTIYATGRGAIQTCCELMRSGRAGELFARHEFFAIDHEDEVSLEDGFREVAFQTRSLNLVQDGPDDFQMEDDPVHRQLDANLADQLEMGAIKRIRQSKQRREFLDELPVGNPESLEIFMRQLRHGLAMVTRHLGDNLGVGAIDSVPSVLADHARRFVVMPGAGVGGAMPDVVEQAGHLEQRAIARAEAVQRVDLIEELERQRGHVLDVDGSCLKLLHQGQRFSSGVVLVHMSGMHRRMRGENDLALEDGLSELRFLGGGGNLVGNRTGGAEVDDDAAGQNLGAEMRDVLPVGTIQPVCHAQHGGELLYAETFQWRERGEFLVLEVRRALAVVARDLGDDLGGLRAEMLPLVAADQPRGFSVMTFPVWAGAVSDVVKAGGGFEEQAIVVTQAVQIRELVEEVDGELRHVLGVVRIGLQRLHQGVDLLACGSDVHGMSRSAPKRSPRVLT